MTSRALIKVGYSCNQNCVFCHSAPHRGFDLNTTALLQRMAEARCLGAEMVVFSGGEPTARPDFLQLAAASRSMGLSLGLVTNARMLAYKNLCRALEGYGLQYLHQSLAGPDPTSHDNAVRCKGAFDQSLRALANLRTTEIERTVNVVVTRQNLDRLQDFAALLSPLGPLRLKFSMVEPEGTALEDFDRLVPTADQAAVRVAAAVERAQAVPGISLATDGFPACLMPGMEDLDAGLRSDGFVWMAEAFEKRFYPVDDRNRGYGSRCSTCSLRQRCRGVYLTYLAKRGEAELRPLSRTVPNSFNLCEDGPPEPLRLSACPIKAGHRSPPDPVRGCLVVRQRGMAQRYAVLGQDFSDESLERALLVRNQVYECRSAALAPTDFAAQLQPLVLAQSCRSCRRKPLCGGCFKPTTLDGFREANRTLARWLRRVRGRVLEIGCGQIPYRAAFDIALRRRELSYLGLDPDFPKDAPTIPDLTGRRTTFEAFRWHGKPFDWVLAIRSLNHLLAPQAAVARMARMVRPGGGRLLLAEDVVFGLIRSQQTMTAIRGRKNMAFEHRFNVELDDVEGWGHELGFRTQYKRSPQQLGCTLWILVMQKN